MRIAGIDEAGRGPCFGPMVISVCVIEKADEDKLREIGVKDSKQLTPQERARQFDQIKNAVLEHASVQIDSPELDALMNQRSLNEIEAMKIAFLLNNLAHKPEIAYIDSPDPIASRFAERIKKYLSFNCVLKTEHKADVNYPVASAASILAKVTRDAAIEALSRKFGDIGSGYPHDEKTVSYLKHYVQTHGELPPFCRKNWETSTRMLDAHHQQKLF